MYVSNITGNFATPYASGGPEVKRTVVLGLTEKTHGNANGIGMADMTTKAVMNEIEWEKGYANALTSTVTDVVKLPIWQCLWLGISKEDLVMLQ